MGANSGVLASLKQSDYTGENRCLPCTVVNAIIAVAASIGIGAGTTAVSSAPVGAGVGTAALLTSAGAIYLRGYLVPGTPALTKQYFPPWLLSLFGKGQTADREYDGDLDPEAVLQEFGVLEPCKGGDDLCLTDSFRDDWNAEIDRVTRADASRERLLELLDIDEGTVEFEEFGDAFRASVDGTVVGKWESEAAFLSDLGAANVLADWDRNWGAFSVQQQSQLLNGIRLFVETCPSCGGALAFGTDTVESCCSTREVAAVTCGDCDARLFETYQL